MNKRHLEIDILRGIAILAMILIHTTYYFLSDHVALTIWNYSQFAVPVFIFCSAYIFFLREYPMNFLSVISYFLKRLKRLLIPYYIFLLIFIPFVYFKEPQKINFQYILDNLLVRGGIDINWLILLFIQLAVVMPILCVLLKKAKLFFYFLCLISFASSFYFLFYKLSFDYKIIMWLPWSTFLYYAIYVIKNEKKKWFYSVTIFVSFIFYSVLGNVQNMYHHSLSFYENKYPPNSYFVFFGIFSTTLLLYMFKHILYQKYILKFLTFLSRYSFQIYFIHYVILYVIATTILYTYPFNWWSFFLIVFIPTIIIQKIFVVMTYNKDVC